MRRGLWPVAVPHVGRTIGLLAVIAHAFALAGLVSGWSVYRAPWVAAALLVGSAALPTLLVVVPRWAGGRLPAWVAVVVAAGILGVSTGVSATLPPEARASMQSWNWSAGAMTCLGLAAYLSTSRIFAVAGAHAALAAAVQVASGGGVWRVYLVLVSTLVPPVGAAQYLRFHVEALRSRARATQARLDAEAERHQADVVRLDGTRRLAALRDEIAPLLEHVATGGPLPLDDVRARRARTLADELRAALVARRQALWLPERLGDTPDGAPVQVVCSDAAARALPPAERAWLAAVLGLLAEHPGWQEVHVVLDARPDARVGVIVTATEPPAGVAGSAAGSVAGSPVTAAAEDRRLRALAAHQAATVTHEARFLTVDADLRARIGA